MPKTFKRRKTFRKKTVDKKQNKRIGRLEKIVKPEIKCHIQPWNVAFDGTNTTDFSTGTTFGQYPLPTAGVNTLPGAMTPIITTLSNFWVETVPGGLSAPVFARHYARVVNQIAQGAEANQREGAELYNLGIMLSWEFQNRSTEPADFDEEVYFRWILTYDNSQRIDLVGSPLDPLNSPGPNSGYSVLTVSSSQLPGSRAVKTHKRPLRVLYDTGMMLASPRTPNSIGGNWDRIKGKKNIKLAKPSTYANENAESVYSGALTLHLYIATNVAAVPIQCYVEPTIYYLDN